MKIFDSETQMLIDSGEIEYNGDSEPLKEDINYEFPEHNFELSDEITVIDGKECRKIIFDDKF